MVSFDHTIPPGGEGKITLKVHTKGYEGSIHKSARVNSNDREQNVVILGIKAFIKVPISLSPRYVSLYGKEGQKITKVVEIRANLEKPLTLTPEGFNLEGKLTYRIDEMEKGRRFKIHFTNTPGPSQRFHGVLNLKTNYPEKPIIDIRIRGRFSKEKKK